MTTELNSELFRLATVVCTTNFPLSIEKANDIIKKGTIKKVSYSSLQEMEKDLTNFLIHYNLYRRRGSLRKELKVKTPFDAVEKWYELDHKIFKDKPKKFKNKILNLRNLNKLKDNNLMKINK